MKRVWMILSIVCETVCDRIEEDVSKMGWSHIFIVLLIVMAMVHATLLIDLSKHIKGLEQRIEQLEAK